MSMSSSSLPTLAQKAVLPKKPPSVVAFSKWPCKPLDPQFLHLHIASQLCNWGPVRMGIKPPYFYPLTVKFWGILKDKKTAGMYISSLLSFTTG